jgi:hypothetical protein
MSQKQYSHPEALVETDWLAQHLDDPSIRVVESNEDVLLYGGETSKTPLYGITYLPRRLPICVLGMESRQRQRLFSTGINRTGGPVTHFGLSVCLVIPEFGF